MRVVSMFQREAAVIVISLVAFLNASPALKAEKPRFECPKSNPILSLVRGMLQTKLQKSLVNIPPKILENMNAGNFKHTPATFISPHAENNLPTPQIISNDGYPSETHQVTTEDGYILEMHRIPHGVAPGSGPGEGSKTPVYVQHGILCSSADWVLSGPEESLAYKLADAGYDVWLGNLRGNTYSKGHESLTEEDSEFWQFDWDQHGKYDAPAMMDLITSVTGKQEMFYIGHSMGSTMFWVLSNERPEYRDRIKGMFALAPVSRVDHMMSPIASIAPFIDELSWILLYFGLDEFLPSDIGIGFLAELICIPGGWSAAICSNILFLICGFDEAQLNEELLPTILGHTPAGTSTRTMAHYAQQVNSGTFSKFDYGPTCNMETYGTPYPPEYERKMVTSPVYAYWSDNDWLAQPEDVAWLVAGLPNLQLDYRVPLDTFNHLDYLWAKDADILVYDDLLERIAAADAQKL